MTKIDSRASISNRIPDITSNGGSLVVPILTAVVLPTLVGLYWPGWLAIIWDLLFWSAFLTVPVLVFGMIITWTRSEDSLSRMIIRFVRPIPPGMVYGTDLKNTGLPVVTIGLILFNGLLYTHVPESVVDHLCLLPMDLPSLPHLLATTVTCAFFHVDFRHLFGNMVFLWAFGATLESRLGANRFATAYLACTLISSFICLNLLLFQVWLDNDPNLLNLFHSLGASGAISGLMGLFVIRCHFAKLSLSLPILFNPVFSVPVRINGLLLIGIFFAMDLSGSMEMLSGEGGRINYWAHLGGFVGGLAVALASGLHKEAEPESRQMRAQRLAAAPLSNEKATDAYREILKSDPDNEPALRHFIHLHRFNPEEQVVYTVRLVNVLMKTDSKEAMALLRETFPLHLNRLDESTQFRLGTAFFQNGEFEKARLCLELAAEHREHLQSKSLLMLGRVYEAIGNTAMARNAWESMLEREDDERFRAEAMGYLDALQPTR